MLRMLNTLLLLFLAPEIKAAVTGWQGNLNIGHCFKYTIFTTYYPCDATKIKCYSDGEEIKFDFLRNKLTYYNQQFLQEVATFLILPDFGQNHKSDDIVDLVSAIYNRYNKGMRRRKTNIIVCEYDSVIRGECFKESEKNLPYIGKCMGRIMNALVKKSMYIIGNGIGAALMTSFAHYYTSSEIMRTTAMDPEGIIYGKTDPDLISYEKNNISHYRDCYHTNGNKYAVKCGSTDWYYNLDDKIQPGCESGTELEQRQCSHDRMIKYYTESIQNMDAFFGVKCDYVKPNFDKKCPNVNAVYRSGLEAIIRDYGNFQVNTRSKSPFGLGKYKNDTTKAS